MPPSRVPRGSSSPGGGCPGPEEIERLAAGDRSSAAVSAHVGSCQKCADRLRDAREEAEFITRVRTLARAGPEGAPRIPGYRPVAVISAGAQGVVYRAIQESTSRTVAIKTLVPAAAGRTTSSRLLRRAEREAEIAARLRHPNIVTVYESRTLADGRIAVIMEFIDGVSLDAWSPPPEQAVTPTDRQRAVLRVFAAVCAGIHHAHLNGVIHRDLKPDNILVTGDNPPRPVILDFGIAKALGGGGRPGSIASTLTGEFAGTPAYASPEQVGGHPDEVDALTDIYSLGVILYRLLCGALPYEVSGSIFDIAQIIRDTQPVPPRHRNPSISTDLEAVLLRALSKDKTRRYQSAAAFARDIEHYLAGDPVDARSGSGWYLLRKAVVVNRRRLAWASAGMVVVLVAGTAVTLSLTSAAESARIAHLRDEQARAESIRARAVTEFLRESLPPLSDADPNRPELANMVASGLDRLYFRIETGGFADDPPVDQSIRRLWGSVYTGFASGAGSAGSGNPQIAFAEDSLRNGLVRLRLAQAAGADNNGEIAATMHALAGVLLARQRTAEAEAMCRDSLAMRERLSAPDAAAVADSRSLLARILAARSDTDGAQRESQAALTIFRTLPDHDGDLRIASMLSLQARIALETGSPARAAAAEPLIRESLVRRLRRLHPIDPDLLASLTDAADFAALCPDSTLIATIAVAWGSTPTSLAADLRRDTPILGTPEPANLGATKSTGRTAALSRLLRLDETLLGPTDPALVDVLTSQMRAAQCEWLPEIRSSAALRAADLLAARFGPADLSVMVCLEEAASVLAYSGHPDRAAEVAGRVSAAWAAMPAAARDPLLAATCTRRRAWYLLMAGQPAQALPLYESAAAEITSLVGPQSYIAAAAQSGLALSKFLTGDRAGGDTLSAQATEIAARAGASAATPRDQLAHIRFIDGHIARLLSQPTRARPMLEQAWADYYAIAGPTFPWRATLLDDLAWACGALGDADAQAKWKGMMEKDRAAK